MVLGGFGYCPAFEGANSEVTRWVRIGLKTRLVTTQRCWLGHLTFSSSSTDVLKGAAVTSSGLHDMPSLLLASYLAPN